MLDSYDSRFVLPRQRWTIYACVLVAATQFTATSFGQVPNKVLPQIEAGTPVAVKPANTPDGQAGANSRWNQVVLLARPKISSGDTSVLPASVQSAVSSLILSVLATVQQDPNASDTPKYRLAEVGVGYAVSVEGQLQIVSLNAPAGKGTPLSFFQRQMLGENEKQIASIPIIAHTSTLLIFDTPALVLRDGQHLDFLMRHFVWINSKTGKLSTLVWLLKPPTPDTPDGLAIVDEPIRWMPQGMKEVREIHVDGNEFSLLGIPTDRAFALEDLPPGKKVPWTPAAKKLAARSAYPENELRKLTAALNAALGELRKKN